MFSFGIRKFVAKILMFWHSDTWDAAWSDEKAEHERALQTDRQAESNR